METPMKVGEADRSSASDIHQLKLWLSTQPHLPSVPENMLHVFHHSCYFDLTKTKDCIDTYYTLRSSCTDIFKDRNLADKDLKAACQNTLNILIPKRSPEDYQIIFQRVESTDCSKYNFEQTCKIFFMGLDSVIHNEGIVPGYMILLDYKNVRLGHLAKTSISSMRKMFRYIQEGSPIRLKSIHMINMNYFIEKVMAFVKPFMHKDLYNLIHFYPEGQMEKLLQYIPYECLPEEYGGKLAPCKVLYDEYLKILEKNRNYFKCEENAFPVQERLRPSNKKNKKKSDEPSEISLKSLEID